MSIILTKETLFLELFLGSSKYFSHVLKGVTGLQEMIFIKIYEASQINANVCCFSPIVGGWTTWIYSILKYYGIVS